MKAKRPKVVIVGAGFGGLRVAQGLRKAPVEITIVDRSNHHLFQPLLYQVATATLSPADIASPIRSVLHRQENATVLMAEVQGVDAAAKKVKLGDRELDYDYLVLATGARHGYFGHDEWAKVAPGLKTIADATDIRTKVLDAFERAEMATDQAAREREMTFVLVGGGPTGVEMAGAIAELAGRALAKDFVHIDPRSARVILIEAGPRILAAFSEKSSRRATESLSRLGVDVRTDGAVENITPEGVWVKGNLIPSATVIWAAGVRASRAAKWLGAEADKAGRVVVGPHLTVPGQADIYVIGDTAACLGKNGKPLPGVAPVAMQQGWYVADVLRKRAEGQPADKPFRYFDKGNLATIGRSAAVAEVGSLKLWGFIAWVTWLVVHIFYLIGFRNRILVLLEWAWAYVFFKSGARLIVPR